MSEYNASLAGRFGWAEPYVEPSPFTLDHDDYDLTVAAAGELTVPGHTIPSYEQVAAKVYGRTSQYLAEHAARGDTPELSFHIPLNGKVGVNYLIAQYDALKAQRDQPSSSVWDGLWDQLGNLDGMNVKPIMMLNDSTHPLGERIQSANAYGEPGLVYTEMAVERQRRVFTHEKTRVAVAAGVALTEVGLSAYIVTNTKRLLTGERPLDKYYTFTQFPHYGDYAVDGGNGLNVVHAGSFDGTLQLQGSVVSWAYPNLGMRRAVEL